ncbi:MAG: bifunctional glutamate N-acetyltransferase/amino-acid acetyltransferase ArgJ [Sulfurospirillaceae bacterium]|nr:bifunctional glutamate N-acetyltransferase/amino-acid acetyltransferase ArgJ [Sulfurospirillaceae bacterium]
MFNIISLQGGLDNVEGFYSSGVSAGFKKDAGLDVAFIRSDLECDVSALFTTNKFQAAPIKHFKRYPKNFKTNFILMNSKNANAITGERGIEDINTIFNNLTNLKLQNPIMSSTGVIGYRLDTKKIQEAIQKFDFNEKNSNAAATAIMTTDSFKKELCVKVELDNGEFFHIAGICKGAGMINPAMATMLCFLVTDANIPKADMDELLLASTEKSFNTISVDGDTSTNDSIFLLSNKTKKCYDKTAFAASLDFITKNLAMMILKDGEGANKVVAFEVNGAASQDDAIKAAKALSNSLLVKTALFGEDPNWGRIASTIGAANIACDEEKLEIYYDQVLVHSINQPTLDTETEARANAVMKQDSFKIKCNLFMGNFSYTAYGCDLSYEYVKINADYRT